MKIYLIFIAFAFAANAGAPSGSAVESHFDKTYALIAATDFRVFLELRDYNKDRIIHDVVLDSRYMHPEFEIMDVALDGSPEFIVRTRGGGTGFAETHFAIYCIVGQRICEIGNFVTDRQANWAPDSLGSNDRETLSGKVSFPEKEKLLYQYTQIRTQNGKTVTNVVTQTFAFDPKTTKFDKVKEPNKTVQRTGASRSAAETNRTSSVAGSRR